VTAVQVRTRWGNLGPDLAAIGPQQRLEAVCRSDAGCANHPGYFGRFNRSAQECNSSVGSISEQTMVFLECSEAFENCARQMTAFTCRAGCKERDVLKNRHTAPIKCNALILLMDTPEG
jgi:hypothetical protein